jgi:hypothetical protein
MQLTLHDTILPYDIRVWQAQLTACLMMHECRCDMTAVLLCYALVCLCVTCLGGVAPLLLLYFLHWRGVSASACCCALDIHCTPCSTCSAEASVLVTSLD